MIIETGIVIDDVESVLSRIRSLSGRTAYVGNIAVIINDLNWFSSYRKSSPMYTLGRIPMNEMDWLNFYCEKKGHLV